MMAKQKYLTLTGILKLLVLMMFLVSCSGTDQGFTVVGDNNNEINRDDYVVGPDGDGGASPPPGEAGCFVNWSGTMKLQVSATKSDGAPLDVLGDLAKEVAVPPIPIKVEGNNLTILASKFPEIEPYLGQSLTDLGVKMLMNAAPGIDGQGTYDPSTGRIEISGLKFLVKVLMSGSSIDMLSKIPPVTFTTDSGMKAHGNGPTPEIVVDGKPLAEDLSITLVIVVDLPDDLNDTDVSDVNNSIGGGALTATFKGKLNQRPEACVGSGDEGGGGGSAGPTIPSNIGIFENNNSIKKIDFGSVPSAVTKKEDKTILDCSDPSNLASKTKLITFRNTGSGERKIKILGVQDTDGDKQKDPLCVGQAEFALGSVIKHGAATCATQKIGAKEFLLADCVIPESTVAEPQGEQESQDGQDPPKPPEINGISIPVTYVPYNFVEPAAVPPAEGEAAAVPPAVSDTGTILIQYDTGEVFPLALQGMTEPDIRDVLSLAKVKDDDTVSNKKIRAGGKVKIALVEAAEVTQKLVLQNSSKETWEDVSLEVEEGSAFSLAEAPAETTLGVQADNGTPGRLPFSITFTPTGSEQIFDGKLKVTLTKASSKTTDNPSGYPTNLEFVLKGTVGLEKLTGQIKLRIDFITAAIQGLIAPIESLDFRRPEFQAQAPAFLMLTLAQDGEDEDLQVGSFEDTAELDLSSAGKAAREKSIRLLNAKGSTEKRTGEPMDSGDDSSLCNEPDRLDVPYKTGDCSYFYFQLIKQEGAKVIYDTDTDQFALVNIGLRMRNPYHNAIASWPSSNPNGYSSGENAGLTFVVDTLLNISLTTYVLDTKQIGEGDNAIILAPSARISNSDLKLPAPDKMGDPCEGDILNPEFHPHFLCYVNGTQTYVQGRVVSVRAENPKQYDAVLVGISRFETISVNPNLAFFLDGRKMHIVLQTTLCAEGDDCSF